MKHVRIFFAVLLTVVSLTQSKPSQAAVGALVSTPVLIAGLAIGGAGLLGTAAGVAGCNRNGDSMNICRDITILIGSPIILLGLIVLEGEQEVQFRELTPSEAAKIGISGDELAVYNSEIDQANMIMGDVKSELSKIERPTAQDSAAAWNNVRDLVSPATYSTMQKIVSQR